MRYLASTTRAGAGEPGHLMYRELQRKSKKDDTRLSTNFSRELAIFIKLQYDSVSLTDALRTTSNFRIRAAIQS